MKTTGIRLSLTYGDKILIGCLVVLSLASYPLIRSVTQAGDVVQIEVNGALYAAVSLHANQTLSVPGPLGTTVITIQNDHVFVTNSPCTNKVCIRTGQISRNGQLIACIPNKIVIRILGKAKPPYDAITR